MIEAHSFGTWLRRRRKGLDLTRGGLAERAGCSAATIQKLEQEERRPSEQIVARLAEIFSIPAGERAAFLRFARGQLRSAIAELEGDQPWTARRQTRSNLPTPITAIVGREAELRDIGEHLLRADVRLVTVTGPPGIGKTRLGVEAAWAALDLCPGGVFFVPLAPLEDPDLLAVTVAQALGYVGAPGDSAEQYVAEGIGDKRMLLVLDNCEHLIEAVAAFVLGLLSACPNLRVLATSREPLHIAGERLYPLPSFDVPGEDSQVDQATVSETATRFPILALFAERAGAVQPDFALTAGNIAIVSNICRQLDGLPLAVELIAARISSMSPPALLERLDDLLLVLAQGMRGVPTRQQSLNNAIDWSYRLLTEEERALFALLSVFSGGFTLAAVEGTLSRAFSVETVARLLFSLVDKSLVQRTIDFQDESRYVMLTTIQGFARQRLRDTGGETTARNWHLAYILALAERADRELRGPNQTEWLNRLDSMRDNVRAALDWAIESGQTEMALQLAHRLWWFWSKRSEFNEGRQWTERVLRMPGASSFQDLYADVLTQSAHHAYLQFGAQDARPASERSLAMARKHGTPQPLAHALMVSGLVKALEGRFAEAESALEESISLFHELNDDWGHALALMSQGYTAYRRNDGASALTLNERALAEFRAGGDRYFQSVCLYEIGSLRARQGDWHAGLADLRQSLALARELGSNYEIASGLLRLAETEQHLGRQARAVRLYCAARLAYDSAGAWRTQEDLMLEERLTQCRAALDETTFATALDESRAMTVEQAISYALEESPER
jgi:predicted ATPase/transcriptional regulator with XRE-family HTH domain